MKLNTFAVMVVAAGSVACGGGGSTGGSGSSGDGGTTGTPVDLPGGTLVSQETISVGDWEQRLATDEELGTAVTQAGEKDYTELVVAGEAKDDADNTATWAVFAKPGVTPAEERVIVRFCDGQASCRSGRILRTTTGEASFERTDGTTDELLKVAPVMIKDLQGKDHEGKTVLAAALTADEVPEVDLKTRRFIIANAFGAAYGVTLGDWVKAAEDSGAFSQIDSHRYVDAATLDEAFRNSSPFDVLIWVGASVREAISGNHKTIGMTTNRAIYGDQTYPASRVKDLLKSSPFGGPGLVMLVGEETKGDGSSEEDEPLSLFRELTDHELGRLVVGVRGRAGTANVLDASYAFLGAYFGGSSVTDSLGAANLLLEERESSATLVSSLGASADETFFVGSLDSLWDGADPPTEVRSNHFLNIANKCYDPASPENVYSEDEGHANFFVDVDFAGPFFSGSRVSEDVGLDVAVEGVLLGLTPGSRVYLKFSGDLKPSMKNISVWGTGKLTDDTNKDKPNRIHYEGTALTTDYTNDKGDTCVLLSPTLTGSTSQPSWMDLP